MKSTHLRFYLFLFFIALVTNGFSVNSANTALGKRFVGGDSAFYQLMKKELHYPAGAIRNSVVGLSVSSVSINSMGEIESIAIVNSVGKNIDKEVRSALKATRRHWLKCDTLSTLQTFYLQVIFNIEVQGNKTDIGAHPLTRDHFSDPVVVISTVSRNLKLPLSNELLNSELSLAIEQKEYQKALTLVNEMIKRRPYEPDLYQLQLFAAKKLNRVDLAEAILHKLDEFVPGISLEELIGK